MRRELTKITPRSPRRKAAPAACSPSGSRAFPEAPRIFWAAWFATATNLKSAWVDVPAEIIESHGAVSTEVAVALADGIRRRTGATLGVGITGVAGPAGGTPEKPVGSVHIAIADERGTKERGVSLPRRPRPHPLASLANALDMVRRYFLYPALGRSMTHAPLRRARYSRSSAPRAARIDRAIETRMRRCALGAPGRNARHPEIYRRNGRSKLDSIKAALSPIHSDRPVDLDFRGLGFFPNEFHPRVIWCGVKGSSNLATMAASVDAALQPLGFSPESREFSPHLTLARFDSHKGLDTLVQRSQ